ncbi:EAL domain-containing protein [Anoxynatronum buryatiense]|uniref:Diguanylate cyclase (GGDEF) domain-containing protein n=1 Tax=Anoxynatronum buryatiense TaxID=489973 RepID=A0AA46AJN4_9CLOT|nr:EAL domain-containing protein [Anoxynatronum buryatiense]SMP61811.1 diguanylate cyclase (GGDEF) domain-containing protein [Anoxynatronum buryatiense]
MKRLIIKKVLLATLAIILIGMTITNRAEATVVRYYADDTYPPYSYASGAGLDGFDVELLEYIMAGTDYHLQVQGMNWINVLEHIESGRADVISSLAKTEARSEVMLFSNPIAGVTNGFFGTAELSGFSMELLADYRIGVGQSYSDEVLLKERLGVEPHQVYRNLNVAVQALLAGQIDLIFAEEQALRHFLIQNRLQGRVVAHATDLYPRDYHFGISKERPELVSLINERLATLQANGTYERIYQKYFHKPSADSLARQRQQQYQRMLLGGLGLAVLLMTVRYGVIRRQMTELRASYQQIRAMEEVLGDQLDQLHQQDRLLRISEERLKHMAYHDELTGLPNLRAFNDYLQQAIEEGDLEQSEVAFLLMDLDDFKLINDMYGHEVGDLVLVEVAARLKDLRPNNAMIARLGGDEYMICMKQMKERQGLHQFVDQLLSAMNQPMKINELDLYLSTSVGIAFYPADAQNPQTLFAHADAAMYLAKKRGRNAAAYYSRDLHEHIRYKLETGAGLRQALELQEFEVYYQPQVEAHTGAIKGVEALLRWRHPSKGMIPPGQFIPIAEETGQILDIGWWLLNQVNTHLEHWWHMGIELVPVSVNISIKQLQHPLFLNRLKKQLQQPGISRTTLKLEITESIAMMNPKETMVNLEQIKALGLEISLDDFGTGFSSMNRLQTMPVQELKIDKSFICDLEKSDKHQAIVQTLVHLAHALDKKVVAEGVETKAQADMLDQYGCDLLQGYYYYRPMPSSDLTGVFLSKSGMNQRTVLSSDKICPGEEGSS